MMCVYATILLTLAMNIASEATVRICEPIKVAMCKNIGYNQTGMPNLARHTLQADADVTLQTFSPLVQYGCSSQLHLFLCAVYVPMCTDKVALPIGPCRGLCESVYERCYPVLRGFGFPWPAELDCSLFPVENNHEHMCMEGPGERTVSGTIPLDTSSANSRSACRRLIKPNSWIWLRGSSRCAQYCDAEVLWEAGESKAAEVWLATWAALSFVCTLAAVVAQLACGDRGGAGERALVLVALCRCAAAAGWGVRAAAGRTAAGCAKDSTSPTRMLLAHDGLANPNCAVVFLLLYYFGMAASVWWVVVAGAWRASVLRPPTTPASARNDRHSSLLQLAAWGVPAALTAAVLVTRDVDADELTGTCYVGNQSSKSLLALVIIPEAICLLLGSVFLASGLRTVLRRPTPTLAPGPLLNGPPQAHTDQSILRLGAFTALYAVPSACILATWIYEFAWRDDWLAAPVPSTEPSTQPRPAFWVFLFRIFATQVLGVMVAVWIATPRLKALWRRISSPRKPALAKPPVGPPPTPLTLHCYAGHPHTLNRHPHKYATYRPPQQQSYRKPRHYHYSAGETIL
ncbi:frizzled-4 [Zerene cesonia]|uniref:frizzled-4 n=1 Tax=Zerene cesonia TaxID=33412 RepID=UPI0018E5657B|nr:frizzled-4 [Zerene cesonia]